MTKDEEKTIGGNLGPRIFRKEAQFIAGAAEVWQLPKLFLPSIAFIGKSNVGKSSLINSVCGRKSLARVSHTPGRTKQINFFSIGEKLILVDLPGYGFAKVSFKERQAWEKLITHYLQNSANLAIVNILIDSRRGIKENDVTVMEMLKSFGKNFQIIFTKADKIKNEWSFLEDMREHLESLNISCNIILTSSRSKKGIKDLQFSVTQGR